MTRWNALRDAADQTAEHNDALNDERHTDRARAFIPDDPRQPDYFDEDAPTLLELERDEQPDAADPWADLLADHAPPARTWAITPDPPF
jgi:hypothetical protein